MPQRSHPVKTALRGTTVSQKTSPQATPSQAIMPAQEGTIVCLELDWTGKRVLLGRSATEHTLAWWHSARIAREGSTVESFMPLSQLVTVMVVITVSQGSTSLTLLTLKMGLLYLGTALYWDCIQVNVKKVTKHLNFLWHFIFLCRWKFCQLYIWEAFAKPIFIGQRKFVLSQIYSFIWAGIQSFMEH